MMMGSYVIDLLPAGRNDVTIEHVGFSTRTFTGFEIQVDQDARLDAQLQIGEARQRREDARSLHGRLLFLRGQAVAGVSENLRARHEMNGAIRR